MRKAHTRRRVPEENSLMESTSPTIWKKKGDLHAKGGYPIRGKTKNIIAEEKRIAPEGERPPKLMKPDRGGALSFSVTKKDALRKGAAMVSSGR